MDGQIEAPVALIVGTRPEGIKMAPVYHALKKANIPTVVCATMQHGPLLSTVLDLFGIVPDETFDVMRPGQDLSYVTTIILHKTKQFLQKYKPRLVLVQGDTSSAMAGALAAFYAGIPVGHVEAGLRTDDRYAPFPEEMNRRLITTLATYHFAPTAEAVAQLENRHVDGKVLCTGNTGIDALHMILERVALGQCALRADAQKIVDEVRAGMYQLAVLTMHRRESFEGGIERVLEAVANVAAQHATLKIVYPYHPNPRVIDALIASGLVHHDRISICEPLEYADMASLLAVATVVLTDSGGIQEEAVSLGKRVVVLREKTERMEGVRAGYARLAGFDREKIKMQVKEALAGQWRVDPEGGVVYGDGLSARRIVSYIRSEWQRLMPRLSPVLHDDNHIPKRQEHQMKTVCVVGLGYIGLPTALVVAQAGYQVIGFDIDRDRVARINAGDPVIHETEVYEKLQQVLVSGRFKATMHVAPADYFVIAVPTPITKHKKADLRAVYEAIDSISSVFRRGCTVIIESTVPVGTTDKIAHYLMQQTGLQVGTDFYVAYCPERVLPGKIFAELIANQRVIGGVCPVSARKARELYSSFVRGDLQLNSARMAEMVKLVENSSRDAALAFAHQVAQLAEIAGLDPYELIDIANKHPRVNILKPTCGVGGHCIAVDPWFLVETFGDQAPFITAARQMNDARPERIVQYVRYAVEQLAKQEQITVLLLGVAYKPNVNDLRESPALEVVHRLVQLDSIHVIVADPHFEQAELAQKTGATVRSVTDGIMQADIVVFLVAHDRFKLIDRTLLQGKQVLDLCGAWYEGTPRVTAPHAQFVPAHSWHSAMKADVAGGA